MTADAITVYLATLVGEVRPKTIADVAGTLSRLPQDVELADLDEAALRKWRRNLFVSPASANKYMSRVRVFLSYCKRQNWIEVNPAEVVRPFDEPAKKRLYLKPGQMTELITGARHPRDRAFLAAASTWLLRGNELARLRVGDLRLEDGVCDVMVSKKKGTFVHDEMVVTGSLARELEQWLGTYNREAGIVGPDAYLFPRMESRLAGDRVVYRLCPSAPISHPATIIKHGLDRIGVVTERRGVHDVRRSMARLTYDALVDSEGKDDALAIVSALLHHSSRRMTELYLGIDGDRTRRNAAMRRDSWFSVLPTANVDETEPSHLAMVLPFTS